MREFLTAVLLFTLCCPSSAAVDGLDIPADFCPGGTGQCSSLVQVQDNHTGFGDNQPGTGDFMAGSELDQLYVFKTQDSLAINIAGNLESNGNAWIILLDVKSGGQSVLDITVGPGSVKGLSGTTLDPGFEPDYAIAINTAGNVYVDLVDIQNMTGRYLGYVPLNAPGVLAGQDANNPNGTALGFNNTNSAGVIGAPPPDKTAAEHAADAATALTGMEMLLKFADIGADAALSEAKIMVLLCGSSGYLSNQTLPGLGADSQKGNLGFGPLNFADEGFAAGEQFATVSLGAAQAPGGPMDGASIPQDSGSATLAATQNNYTGFGNASGTGTAPNPGSEIDALFMSNTSSALQIGITGNLEANGNYLMLLLDTGDDGVGPEGVNVPEGVGPQSGVLQSLNGSVFDEAFRPTHAVLVDSGSEETPAGSGTYVTYAYLHIFDFRNNQSRYIGRAEVNSGSSVLAEGDNPGGILMAFNNTNQAGVTNNNNKTAQENYADALTAVTGLEIVLPFSEIGLGRTAIRYLAGITGNKGYLSNQFLPGLGGGVGNLGDPPFNFVLMPGDQFGVYGVSDLAYTPQNSLADWKAAADGTAGVVTSTVSAVLSDKDVFYIQDSWPHHIAGVLVTGTSSGLSVGDRVTVQGLISRSGGERAINPVSVTPAGTGTAPQPIFTVQQRLGGADAGSSPGVGGSGANNVGLLMRTTGKVQFVAFDDDGTAYAYIDDGSGLLDGNMFAVPGLRVDLAGGMALPSIGSTVAVTGVSSVIRIDGLSQRRLRARSDADVTLIQ